MHEVRVVGDLSSHLLCVNPCCPTLKKEQNLTNKQAKKHAYCFIKIISCVSRMDESFLEYLAFQDALRLNATDIAIAVNENQYQSPSSLFITICCDHNHAYARLIARELAKEESKSEESYDDATDYTFINRQNVVKYQQAKVDEAASKAAIASTQSLLADAKTRVEGESKDKDDSSKNACNAEIQALESKLREQNADHEIHVQKRRRVAVECAQAENKPVCASESLQKRVRRNTIRCAHMRNGTLSESSVIERLRSDGWRIEDSQKVAKKRIPLSSDIDIQITGKIDGIVDDDTILEIKKRQRPLRGDRPMHSYDKVQVMVYMWLFNKSKSKLVEADNAGRMRHLDQLFDEQYFNDTIRGGVDRWYTDFRNFLLKPEEEQLQFVLEDVRLHRNPQNHMNNYFERFMNLI